MFDLICSSTWKTELAELFTKTEGIICMVCLGIGLILLAIEMFVPGFGVFGISGIVFSTFSFIYMLIADGSWQKFLYMIGIATIILTIVILVAVRSARFGLISRSPLIQKGTALPEDYADNDKNYSYLVGKNGKLHTSCKPTGKAEIDGQLYTVVTTGDFLERGTNVYVSNVDGNSIIVKVRGE
ncbi:MAG: hypothetical protein J6T39_00610 [Clostridia bacterium]|nr:hypothetical protein [Clostridia bacterium]